MTKKYKVNEVAKDLQVENKEVIEVLKELGGGTKESDHCIDGRGTGHCI